jgi:two-component system, NarL family, nitrate/nitrite response regulator NarL
MKTTVGHITDSFDATRPEHGDRRLSILLASDFPIFRDTLTAHFAKALDIHVVGCARDPGEVLTLLSSTQPKLVVLDLNIEWDSLYALLDQIHANSSVRSLVMSDMLDSSRLIEVLQHGTHGVVPRRTTLDLLSKSIQTVVAGEFWVSRAIVTDLAQIIRESAAANRQKISYGMDLVENPGLATSQAAFEAEIARLGLTRRELEIIGAVVEGQTNKDIAATFRISEHTVKHHLTNIYDKLGVYNRVELVLFAINRGFCASN